MSGINNSHIYDFTKALLEIAEEENKVDVISRDIATIQEHRELLQESLSQIAFRTLSKAEQLSITHNFFTILNISTLFFNATKVLINNQGYDAFIYFIKNWNTIKLSYLGYKQVDIYSVYPLTNSQTEIIKNILQKKYGDKFFLITTVDPSILGGLVIKVDDWLFDDSLKTKLKNIQNFIKEQ